MNKTFSRVSIALLVIAAAGTATQASSRHAAVNTVPLRVCGKVVDPTHRFPEMKGEVVKLIVKAKWKFFPFEATRHVRLRGDNGDSACIEDTINPMAKGGKIDKITLEFRGFRHNMTGRQGNFKFRDGEWYSERKKSQLRGIVVEGTITIPPGPGLAELNAGQQGQTPASEETLEADQYGSPEAYESVIDPKEID